MLKLRFLTDDSRWIELATMYWQYDKQNRNFPVLVEEIAKAIPANSRTVSKILATYCLAYDDRYLCSRCGEPAKVFLSRADFLARGTVTIHSKPGAPLLCANCHKLLEDENRAEALRKKQAQDAQKLQLLRGLKGKQAKVDLHNLTLDQAIFLDACGRAGLTEDLGMLLSLHSIRRWKRKLAPLKEHEEQIIQRLYEDHLIVPHPRNNPDVIQNMESIEVYEVDLLEAHWYFPVSIQNPAEPASLYHEIEEVFTTQSWPEAWYQQAFSLWQTVANWECLEFLIYVMELHDLPFKPGKKTVDTLRSLLTRFSTAQIHNFIWRAGRNAAAFYMRGEGNKWQSANTVVGSLQRLAERAEAEGWEVKNFRRNFDCPQSLVSQVLFDAALKIGEDGFTSVPYQLDL